MKDVAVGAAVRVAREIARDLPADLVYHDAFHTFEVVVPAARRLAVEEKLDARVRELVTLGAAFHDLGMLEAYHGHENVSARIARTELGRLGFEEDEIAAVEGMIRATRLPQRPRNAAERVVADADLDVLGRPDFLEINRRLRDELARRGTPLSDVEWYGRQCEFLRGHRYFTDAARRWRGPRKGVNLAQLEALLAEAEARETT